MIDIHHAIVKCNALLKFFTFPENEHCSLFPYEKDSSFYLENTENRTVIRPCPEGTAFDLRSCACTIMTSVRSFSGKLFIFIKAFFYLLMIVSVMLLYQYIIASDICEI